MAGKSTLMRQTGLCLLLAQCGLPVPAESLDFAPCNGFFSRMGAADRILEGESTFMVEMKESAEILRDADSNSLVLIDEIGRGTSTQDGLAIAQSVLEHIHNEVSCLCIFATHYHELSDSVNRLDCAINASMAIREWKGDLIFLRKVKFEPAASSYGIYVAKIAGLPKTLVQRAQKILTVLKNSSQESTSSFDLNEDFSMKPGQLDIFSSPVQNVQNSERLVNCVDHEMNSAKFISLKAQKFANEIQALDLNEMSPRQAWEWIEAQQRSLEPETITSDEGPELSFLGKSPQGV
jgi:DNA mismatch repair protein MutS